jgi:dTDP-glucose pyrophosphorylase
MKEDFFIQETETVKGALKKLDKTAEKTLLLVDDMGRLLGAITDGDIRRHILRGGGLDETVAGIYNTNPLCLIDKEYTWEEQKKIFLETKVELLPIIDKERKILDFVTWDKTFSEAQFKPRQKLDLPVVIMAGGKGTRMDPFTKILPKPLIPVGDKPIIEIIIDEFKKFGIDKYFLTLNYKAELIESYFNGIERDYDVEYIREDDFYGTAGSLKFLQDVIPGLFIVSNCDVIVKADYGEVIRLHKEKQALLTVVSSIQHYKLPYGIVKFSNGGNVSDITEKPEYTFAINTGVYVLSRETLSLIPEKTPFDMTDLIRALLDRKERVITYPVNESEYMDLGQLDEYKRTVERLCL